MADGDDNMKTMKDKIFGELTYDYIWNKQIILKCWGKECKVELFIDGEEDGVFEKEQYEAYKAFLDRWEEWQPKLLPYILDSYLDLREEFGYDVEEDENYPDIETEEEIADMISVATLLVHAPNRKGKHRIGLTVYGTWDSEYGVGFCFTNDELTEVGGVDVAD